MTNEIVALINIIGAFAIVGLMLETTRCKRDRAQNRWARVRRVIYGLVAIALFTLGVFTADLSFAIPVPMAVAWFVILFSLVFFPAVRAAGLIDQDRWVGFGWRRRPF